MNYKKTPKSKRQSYVYTYYEGREKKTVCLNSGEFGVTDQHIAKLHSLDDNEVYNNVKNSHAPFTEEQKQEIQEWLNNHPGENIASFSDIYNVSIDYCMEQKGNREANQIIGRLSTYNDVSPEVERLREVVELLEPFDRIIYECVFLKGMTKTNTAELLFVTEGTVRYHLKKIKEFIKNNY